MLYKIILFIYLYINIFDIYFDAFPSFCDGNSPVEKR